MAAGARLVVGVGQLEEPSLQVDLVVGRVQRRSSRPVHGHARLLSWSVMSMPERPRRAGWPGCGSWHLRAESATIRSLTERGRRARSHLCLGLAVGPWDDGDA